MELHFLGRGAAFYVEAGNTSAYLREGSRLLLLDCGESVFADLPVSYTHLRAHET